jgi:hypothetical protein
LKKAQGVEHLLCKCEALSSNPRLTNPLKREGGRERERETENTIFSQNSLKASNQNNVVLASGQTER